MLSATRVLDMPNFGARIRLMSMQEAEELADLIRRRNVFARHSREDNFYVQLAHELGGSTIIEIVLPGQPAVLRAHGGVWHNKHRAQGVVPPTSIDPEAHWTQSG